MVGLQRVLAVVLRSIRVRGLLLFVPLLLLLFVLLFVPMPLALILVALSLSMPLLLILAPLILVPLSSSVVKSMT
jgi:hypothetical protein